MRSPGTNSLASGVIHAPSRITRALTASFAFSAPIALPAWRSSQNPIAALKNRSSSIMRKSGQCRTAADRTTATSIIHGIGPQKYFRNIRYILVFFSGISLGPYCASRFVASRAVRPSLPDPSFFSTCSIGKVCRSVFCFGADAWPFAARRLISASLRRKPLRAMAATVRPSTMPEIMTPGCCTIAARKLAPDLTRSMPRLENPFAAAARPEKIETKAE